MSSEGENWGKGRPLFQNTKWYQSHEGNYGSQERGSGDNEVKARAVHEE